MKIRTCRAGLALAALAAFAPAASRAHCNSMDGPVVAQALDALASGDIAPTLKWVRAQDEAELREAFQRALAARQLGGEATELSDLYFLETLVRIHREGEGAPYAGLRPAGQLEPVYLAADRALDDGSADRLAGRVAREVESAIASRFAEAMELRARAESIPEAGRAYVAAYVRYMHFVESVHELLAHGDASGHEGH